jgi:hypothetical protein
MDYRGAARALPTWMLQSSVRSAMTTGTWTQP